MENAYKLTYVYTFMLYLTLYTHPHPAHRPLSVDFIHSQCTQ